MNISILQSPSVVIAKKDFKVGALTLVAAAPRLDRKLSTGCVSIGEYELGSESVELFLPSNFVAPFTAQDELAKAPWVVPFWFAQRVAPGEETMTLKIQTHTIMDISVHVPVLVNNTQIKKGDAILVDNTMQVQAEEGGADKVENAPKRKRT